MNRCFGCGPENPIGLKLQFAVDGDRVSAEFNPLQFHQSWNGVLHGGLIMTALDEIVGNLLLSRGLCALLAKMETRFRQSIPTNEKVIFRGELLRVTKKIAEARASAEREDGSLAVESSLLYVIVPAERVIK